MCVCACVHVCVYVGGCAYVHVCVLVRTYICTRVVATCVFFHLYNHIHIHSVRPTFNLREEQVST